LGERHRAEKLVGGNRVWMNIGSLGRSFGLS
jgi:hypothetical protein